MTRAPEKSRSFVPWCVNLGDYGLVDADNDGHADASWLDLGSPIYTSENGTLFKPLFGFVIEDMD